MTLLFFCEHYAYKFFEICKNKIRSLGTKLRLFKLYLTILNLRLMMGLWSGGGYMRRQGCQPCPPSQGAVPRMKTYAPHQQKFYPPPCGLSSPLILIFVHGTLMLVCELLLRVPTFGALMSACKLPHASKGVPAKLILVTCFF